MTDRKERWFVKRTSRGDWAVRGNSPQLATVIELTREAAQKTCNEMNRMARERERAALERAP